MITLISKAIEAIPTVDLIFVGILTVGVGWHFYDKETALYENTVKVNAEWQGKLDEANRTIKATHDTMQAKIDAQAPAAMAEVADKLDAINTRLSRIGTIYAPSKALPVNCRFDDERVRMANAAIGRK